MEVDMRAAFDKEQFNRDTIETDKGLLVYNKYEDNSVYVHILYIKPEFRVGGEGKKLIDMMVDKENPHTIYTYVDINTNNPELSLIAILKGGGIIDSLQSNRIIIKNIIKEVK